MSPWVEQGIPPAELGARLLALCPAQPDAAAALLSEALGPPDPTATPIDDVALDLLAHQTTREALTGHLPLGQLAALVARTTDRLGAEVEPPAVLQSGAATLLDALAGRALRRRIAAAEGERAWFERLHGLVEASGTTVASLWRRRTEQYRDQPLFQLNQRGEPTTVSFGQAAGRAALMARGLLALGVGTATSPLGVLSHNRIEVALLDLACLSSGIVTAVIPATSSEQDVAYILRHAGVSAAVVSDRRQLDKLRAAAQPDGALSTLIALDDSAAAEPDVLSLGQLLARAADVSQQALEQRQRQLGLDHLATIMYTSGTTGKPKGICFSQRNIVLKRFARALALPEIGSGDRLLAYLPLFHTFGRFFELLGAVFWGARYCFADSPAIEVLSRQMRELKPSVFISIPMKWTQLYDLIRRQVDVESSSDERITTAVHQVCGDKLRWGLSAAGYLDPEIFHFFQRHGVELMSGFGMTEATGGITMTPPGQYRDDSLGLPLPGIEIGLAEDGELLMRGPYVMTGYRDPPDGQPSFDAEGWFHSGDIMERDAADHLRLVDRKKEIYKNIKGQTIAPQKIEKLFKDFESVARIFVVGDHRPFNTALIYPDARYDAVDLSALDPEHLQSHFRSLVVTVNSFLAPFERIVDFAVIDRDFSAELGELTPKNTFKRKVIERHFADTTRRLYRRANISLDHAEVTVPGWLVQALGITAGEIGAEHDELLLHAGGTRLTVRRLAPDTVQVGAVRYRHARHAVSLGFLLSAPRLWLGNEQLVAFAPLDTPLRQRRLRRSFHVERLGRVAPYQPKDGDRQSVTALLTKPQLDLMDLHRAALLIDSAEPADAIAGVRALEHALDVDEPALAEAGRAVLRRCARCPLIEVRRRALQVLAAGEIPARYRQMLSTFMGEAEALLDNETRAVLVQRDLDSEHLAAFMTETEARIRAAARGKTPMAHPVALLNLLAEYGAAHPARYRTIRAFFARQQMLAPCPDIRPHAAAARQGMTAGLQRWLGAPRLIAVDPETGLEYRWEDVVGFADDVVPEARHRLLDAMRTTSVLSEGALLFGGGRRVRLENILPGGVWVRLLGADHGKSVYRVAIRTRDGDLLDVAVNLSNHLSASEVDEELCWLAICAAPRGRMPLVEELGGYSPAHGLWTEEFIHGETLERALRRLSRRPADESWFMGVWPFAAWSALSAYFELWERTGRTRVVADPTARNVIVPIHDYHVGARLVSISALRRFESLPELLLALMAELIEAVEHEHPRLAGLVGWGIVFSALLEVVGEQEGTRLLEAARNHELLRTHREVAHALDEFMSAVQRYGFMPRRLFFATKRYQRWAQLNTHATHAARANTLHQLYKTYRLRNLQRSYPEARVRFFRETVFCDASPPLAAGLEQLTDRLRRATLPPDELAAAVADLRAHLRLGGEEDYFLARLSYPHLKPEDEASFVELLAGGSQQSEIVVTISDGEGRPLRIRHALSPKEIGRLHRMFQGAKLVVQLKPEHRFLVALDQRDHVVGGLFYELDTDTETAHMEKVVVTERLQGQGIAGALLEELCQRLTAAGYRAVTTGFFRPQFFYRYGFSVDRRYAGLVRALRRPEPSRTGSGPTDEPPRSESEPDSDPPPMA